jgi:hypothetical protein
MLALWIAWATLTIVVMMLAIFRKFSARNQDSCVHLTDAEAPAIIEQATVVGKLDKVDHWGKTLTVVDIAFLAVMRGIVFYNAWRTSLESM